MPESPGGVDIATLGLRVDASQFVEANKQQEAFVRTGEKVEAQAKRLTDASTQRARAVESEAQRIQRLQVQEEAAAQAHQNFLQRRQQQEAQSAQATVAQAAEAGRQQALAQADAAERTYLRRVNQLKLAQAQGLLGPREAQKAGAEFAQAYNQAIAGAISTAQAGSFSGAQGEETFNRLAGSLKNVQQASRNAGLGMGRLNNSMVVVARQSLGLSSTAGRLVDTIGTFAIGTAYMVPVLAGLAAIGAVWERITREAREARKAQQEAIGSLRSRVEADRTRSLGPGGELREQADLARAEADDLRDMFSEMEERADRAGRAILFAFGPGISAISEFRVALDEWRFPGLKGDLEEAIALAERAEELADRLDRRRNIELGATELEARGLDEEAQALRDHLDLLEAKESGYTDAQLAQLRIIQGLEAEARALEEARRGQKAAAQAQEEARRAAEAERQTLVRAVDLRVEQRSDLERLLEIQQDLLRLSEDETRSRIEQVDAAEDLLAVTRAIETFRARNVSLDSDIGERPVGGPGAAPRDRLSLDFGGLDDFEKRIQRSVNLANLSIGSLSDEIGGLSVASAVVGGLASVADTLFNLSPAGRAAFRGLSDVLAGLDAIKGAEGGIGSVAGIGGALSVAGGVAGVLNNIINDDDVERVRQAARDFNDALDRFVEGLSDRTRFEQLRRDAGDEALAVAQEMVEVWAQSFPDLVRDDVLAEVERIFREFEGDPEEMLRNLEQMFGDDAQAVLDAYLGHMELIEEQRQKEIAAMEDDFRVRLLVAQGRDEEAEALRRDIEQRREVAEAIALGDDALVEFIESVHVAEDAFREAAAAAELLGDFDSTFASEMRKRARRTGDFDALRNIGEADIQRQLEPFRELVDAGLITEHAFTLLAATMRGNMVDAINEQERAWEHAGEQFLRDVEAREKALAGDDRGALEAQLRADAEAEIFRAREMLIAGQITQEAFDRLVAVIEGEVVDALEDFDEAARDAAKAAREAAEAERFRAQVDLENLRIRILVAQGRDAEAQAMRDQLEILQAVEEGRSATYIALLRQAQAAEAARRATQKRTESERDLRKELELTSRVFNAPAGFSRTLARLRQQASEFSNPIQLPGGGTFGGVRQSVASRAAGGLDAESVEVTPDFDVIDPDPIPVAPTFLLVDPDPLSVSPQVELQEPAPLAVEPSFALIEPDPLEVTPRLDMEDPAPLSVTPSFALVEPDPLRVEPALEQVPPDPIFVEPAFALVAPEPMAVEPAFDLVPPDPVAFTPPMEMTEPDPLAVDPVFQVPDVEPIEVMPGFVALPTEPLAVRPDFDALPPETLGVQPDIDLLPPEPLVVEPALDVLPPARMPVEPRFSLQEPPPLGVSPEFDLDPVPPLPVEPAFDLLDPDPLRITPEFEVERTPPIALTPEFDLGGLPELLAERTVFGVRTPDFGSRESESAGPSPDRQPPRTESRTTSITYQFGDLVVPVPAGQDGEEMLDEILRAARRRALAGGGNVFEEQFE